MNYQDRVNAAQRFYRPTHSGLGFTFYPAGRGKFWRAVANMARPTWADREMIEHKRNAERAQWYAGLKRFARPE